VKRFLAVFLLLAVTCGEARAWTQQAIGFSPAGRAEEIIGKLIRPEGAGPFPALVILHDCSGLGAYSSQWVERWSFELVEKGYVILMPDSFWSRGFKDGVCSATAEQQQSVDATVRTADAFGALAYLRTLPFVDGAHVGLMGASHGGWTAMEAVLSDGFAAAIAFYPTCAAAYGDWSTTRASGLGTPVTAYLGVYRPQAPLLILIGEKDDWSLAEHCRHLVETSLAGGYDIGLKVYPDALHAFDGPSPTSYVASRANANAPNGRGATTGGHSKSWWDARKQVKAFFAQHLKGETSPSR
jgi:dienelactone hydrolase